MKALEWYGRNDIRIEEVPEPSPASGEVKIKVKCCAICTSDIHEFTDGPILIPTTRPHPVTGKQAPVVLGHEFSGDVVEVGDGVTSLSIGDRVAVRPTMPCYQCYWCRKGRHILCNNLATIGFAADGGFADYAVVRSDTVYVIPDGITYEMAALCEPGAVAIHACKRACLTPGDYVAIIGAGPIGLLVMQAAKAAGASVLFVIEPLLQRRQIAKELGATVLIDPREADPGRMVADFTERRRADVVFECVGSAEGMLQCLALSSKGGKIVVVGQAIQTCSFPFGQVMALEKVIIGSCGYEDEFSVAISYLNDRRLNTKPLVTTRIRLNQVVDDGFYLLTSKRKHEHIKIVVSPEDVTEESSHGF